jgi:hypothetical protein
MSAQDELIRMTKISLQRKRAFGAKLLDPGTRSTIMRFEKAVREYAQNEDLVFARKQYINAKRALIRRILRITGEIPFDTRGRRKNP